MSYYFQYREWTDHHVDPLTNRLSDEFLEGVNVFIEFPCNQPSYQETNTILCPCARCKNKKQHDAKTVIEHLFGEGFKGNNYFWLNHGVIMMLKNHQE